MFLFDACAQAICAGVAFDSSFFCCVEMFVFDYLMKILFIFVNAELCSYFQFSLLLFVSVFFFSISRSGSESSAIIGMNLFRWCTLPRNTRSCLSVYGLTNFIIASVFATSGVFPVGVIVNPNHSISFIANSHFWRLIAKPSVSNLHRILSNSCSFSLMVPFVITNISSRKANLDDMPSKVFVDCCRHISRSHLGIYVPVALPPRILTLQCLAIDWSRRIWL